MSLGVSRVDPCRSKTVSYAHNLLQATSYPPTLSKTVPKSLNSTPPCSWKYPMKTTRTNHAKPVVKTTMKTY